MNRIVPLSIILILTMQGCATNERVESNTTDNRACASNFYTEGGFWTGTQYKTYEIFPKTSKTIAFDSLLSSIASGGYQVTSSNKDIGMISANQTVSYGQGKTAPINVVIKDNQSGGVRIDLVFSVSGGVAAPTDSVKNEFCKFLSSVSLASETRAPKIESAPPKEPSKAKNKKK